MFQFEVHISSILLETAIIQSTVNATKKLTEQAANSKSNYMQKVRNIGKQHKKAKAWKMVKSKARAKQMANG